MLQTQKLASRRSEKPPKLPPRDNMYHPHDIPKPDYDDINDDERLRAFRVKSDKGRDLNKKYGKFRRVCVCVTRPECTAEPSSAVSSLHTIQSLNRHIAYMSIVDELMTMLFCIRRECRRFASAVKAKTIEEH